MGDDSGKIVEGAALGLPELPQPMRATARASAASATASALVLRILVFTLSPLVGPSGRSGVVTSG